MPDLLNMEFINSLPQPLIANLYGGSRYPAGDVDVESGLLKIDVCGMTEVKHISDVSYFEDGDGERHGADSFYSA